MSEIKIGDKVVCVNDIRWDNIMDVKLIYNNEYIVLDRIYCERCEKFHYDIGCRIKENEYSTCGGYYIAGKGIDWVQEYRLKPYFVNFKNFVRKEIIEHIHEDIKKSVESKEYENAIDLIKRLEKINNEI